MKSTIIGVGFLAISLGLFCHSYFTLGNEIDKMSFESWFIGFFLVMGTVSVLGKFKWIDKIIDSKFPNK